MNFDIRSIIVAVHAVVWINLVLMIIVWVKAVSTRPITRFWILSHILYSSGSLLVALRNITGDFWSIIVANACLVGAQIAVQEGLEIYVHKRPHYRQWSIGVFVLHMIGIMIFTYIVPSLSYRILLYGLSVSCIAGIGIRTVYAEREFRDPSCLFLMLVLGFTILVVLARGAMAWLSGDYEDLMQASSGQFIGIVSMLLAYVSLSIALFWLIVHKLGGEMRQTSMTDSLTHIGSRRALEDLVRKKQQKASSIAVMMIDIDRFKDINDTYGHQAGDLYLVEFAKLACEESGHVFRYAGDEFIIIHYDLDWDSLKYKAEKLRGKVQSMKVAYLQDVPIATTISIGIALADIAVNWDNLLREADHALYAVKRKNGNQVGFL